MKRERPIKDNGPEVGQNRHDRYAAAIKRCNESMNEGFYVESIAIIESLIGDRLESITNQILKGGWSYKTVSQLVKQLQKLNPDPPFSDEFKSIIKQIDEWFKKRSFAVHELAKLTTDMKESFSDSYSKLEGIANEGKDLFRKIDNHIKKYRSIKIKKYT